MSRLLRGFAVRAARLAAAKQFPVPQRVSIQSQVASSCLSNRAGTSFCRSHPCLQPHQRRNMSLSAEDVEKRMRDVNDMFVEARELIADALDSQGTKYFEEDLDDARDMVKNCLEGYEAVLEEVDETKRGEIQRSMGMKMRQLKDELGQIISSLTHDEELPESSRKEDK